MTNRDAYPPIVIKDAIHRKIEKRRHGWFCEHCLGWQANENPCHNCAGVVIWKQKKIVPFINQDLWLITAPLEAVGGGKPGRQKVLFYIFPDKWTTWQEVSAKDLDDYERAILNEWIQCDYVKKNQQPDASKRLSFQRHLQQEVTEIIADLDDILARNYGAVPESLHNERPSMDGVSIASLGTKRMQCGHNSNAVDNEGRPMCSTCADWVVDAEKDPARVQQKF